MPLEQRQEIMRKIEAERGGRVLVCFFHFDRESTPPIPGLRTQFSTNTKEALFRVLKETVQNGEKIDVCLYSRGGDTNAVWPLVNLLREFDPAFEVLVPFRCHSGGTLLALGAKKICMTPLAELSPIDPSTGNQFNPVDPNEPRNRLAISVEDVQQYRSFILNQFRYDEGDGNDWRDHLRPYLERLVDSVHPLALGNVHRVHQQIKQLARELLQIHRGDAEANGESLDTIVESLTTRFFSHLHMISRHEARRIIGEDQVEFASDKLSQFLDELLRVYEDDFALRTPFFLVDHLGDSAASEARFIGGAVESRSWSYLFETKARLMQHSAFPPNVQVQLPPGQAMPLVPGLPRECRIEVTAQSWVRNTEPQGVTV